jgi:spermidine synthase
VASAAIARHAAFFAAGLLATGSQVLLLRELVVDAAGDEAAIGVGLAAWLLGIAVGASFLRRRLRRRPAASASPAAAVGLAFLALAPTMGMITGRLLRRALAPDAGELPGLDLSLATAAATLAPPGAAVGFAFTALAAAASRLWSAGEGIARLYVAESLGSLAGGGLVTLVVAVSVPPLPLAALVGVLGSLLVLLATRSGVVARPLPVAAVAAALGLLVVAGRLDRYTEALRFTGIAPGIPLQATVDTPYQHLDLGGDETQHVYASGQYASSFPDPWSAESLGHLVALLAPEPRRVLLLGGWERGLVPVLLRHPVEELFVVEPDERAFAFLVPRLPEADRAALRDRRVRVVHDDPRRFVAHGQVGGPFDLVVLLGPDPSTLLRARLATVEFFDLVARRLRPEGTVVMSVKTAPAALTGETAGLAGSLFRSLEEAFPVVTATPGPDSLFVAGFSKEAATLDPAVLGRRWAAHGVDSPAFDASLLPALLDPRRVSAEEGALRGVAEEAEPSRDDRPVSFLHALSRREQTTSGAAGRLVGAAFRLPLLLLVTLALLPSLLTLLRLPFSKAGAARVALAASHAVAVGGAAGIGWSLLVLFSYQTHAGALYGELGLLTGVFMLGLAVGAALARRLLSIGREGRDAGASASRALRLCLVLAVAFAATLPPALEAAGLAARGGGGAALAAYGALLLAAGALTGAIFPIAAECRLAAGDGAGDAAGRLETADHLGAAVAALAGAVVFVPALGIERSAWVLAGLLALALAASVGARAADRAEP